MRERRNAKAPPSDEPPEELRPSIEAARIRFGSDREGFEAWLAAYRENGWRHPPVKRLRIVDPQA